MKGAQVATLPEPTLTDTVQFGSVWKSSRATLDVDVYHINYQNDYSSATDAVTGDTNWFANGNAMTQGRRSREHDLVGGGLAVYLNGTAGSAKYDDTGLWAQNTPKDTETIGLTYNQRQLEPRALQQARRPAVQRQRRRSRGVRHRSVQHHQPVLQLHAARGRRCSRSRGSGSAINNLTDSHALTGVPKGGTAKSTSAAPAPADIADRHSNT